MAGWRLRRFYDPPWLVGIVAACATLACGWMAVTIAGRPPDGWGDWALLILTSALAVYFAAILLLVLLGRMPRWLHR